MNPATRAVALKLIWGALTASLFLYLIVGFMLIPSHREQPLGQDAFLLRIVFYAMILVMIVVSTLTYSKHLSVRKLESRYPLEGERLLENTWTPYVICWVLNESVCVFGLVLAALGSGFSVMLPYFAIALTLNLRMFPRVAGVIQRLSTGKIEPS